MNNLKLIYFALLLLLFIIFIQFKKELFVLFEEGHGNFTTQVTGETFPKTLTDVTGITYHLKKTPQRILSATLATDHILADLINPDRLVAVSSYVDYPSLSNIVGFYDKNISRTQGEIESMLALQPDLVFVASYRLILVLLSGYFYWSTNKNKRQPFHGYLRRRTADSTCYCGIRE